MHFEAIGSAELLNVEEIFAELLNVEEIFTELLKVKEIFAELLKVKDALSIENSFMLNVSLNFRLRLAVCRAGRERAAVQTFFLLKQERLWQGILTLMGKNNIIN